MIGFMKKTAVFIRNRKTLYSYFIVFPFQKKNILERVHPLTKRRAYLRMALKGMPHCAFISYPLSEGC